MDLSVSYTDAGGWRFMANHGRSISSLGSGTSEVEPFPQGSPRSSVSHLMKYLPTEWLSSKDKMIVHFFYMVYI
jgi:hypothetical protein